MGALDKFYDFTLNLPNAKLTSKAMSLCNIDRNVFNIYLTLQEGKNNPILNANLGDYTVTMIVVKPKTKEYVEKVGVIDGSNDRLLFELGETFNDQIGSYKGEIKVQSGDEVITSSSFAYTVTQSLISGLNAEIEANPDVEILRKLINEVKTAVGMIPEDPDSLLTDYQKKTDNTLITTDKTIIGAINENSSQIDTIANDLIEYTGEKKQVYLKEEQYIELKELGKIIIDDKEYIYDSENTVYNIIDSEETNGLTEEQIKQLTTAYNHSKESHAPSNAEENIQPDWNEEDESSDSYIKNKPMSLGWDGILTSESGYKFILKVADNGDLSTEQIIEYGNIVTSVSSLSCNEDGISTFTVKLDNAPTYDMTISLTVNNAYCTIDKDSLVFTPSNYNIEQTVTVAGVNDTSSIANKTSIITLSNDNVSDVVLNVTIMNTTLETTYKTYTGYPLSIVEANCDINMKSYISKISGNGIASEFGYDGLGLDNEDGTYSINLNVTTGSESLSKTIDIPNKLYKINTMSDEVYWDDSENKYRIKKRIKSLDMTSFTPTVYDEGSYYLCIMANDGYPGEGGDAGLHQQYYTNLPKNIEVVFRYDGQVFIKAYKTDYTSSTEVSDLFTSSTIFYYTTEDNFIDTTIVNVIDFKTNNTMLINCADNITPSEISVEVPVKG